MKTITFRIEEDQLNELKEIAKDYKINGVSSLIRRGVDMYITSEKYYRKEKIYEHDKHQ